MREVLVNGSEPFRFVCALQISMSSPRCSYHALFGANPNNCSTWSYSKLLLHYMYLVANRIRIVEQPFGIAPSGAWKHHLQYDKEICEVHTDLNVVDPLTKTSLSSKT